MSTSIVVAYPFTADKLNADLALISARTFDTPVAYKEGVKSIAACRAFRVQIEDRRKLLKQDSLEYGRRVDSVAAQLVALVEAVEQPLKLAKLEVDNAKAAAKRAREDAERKVVEDRIRAEREAEEAALRVQREADELRLRQARHELEQERKAHRDEQERQFAEAKAVRARIEEERAALQAEQDKLRLEASEWRIAKEKMDHEKRAQELAERLAAEEAERELNRREYEAARAKREAALQPDKAKLATFLSHINALSERAEEWRPDAPELLEAWDEAYELIGEASDVLRRVKP